MLSIVSRRIVRYQYRYIWVILRKYAPNCLPKPPGPVIRRNTYGYSATSEHLAVSDCDETVPANWLAACAVDNRLVGWVVFACGGGVVGKKEVVLRIVGNQEGASTVEANGPSPGVRGAGRLSGGCPTSAG